MKSVRGCTNGRKEGRIYVCKKRDFHDAYLDLGFAQRRADGMRA